MNESNYTYSFLTSKSPETVFNTLLHIKEWWSGLYSEKITGKSSELNDEFSFRAGDGAHYSKQKLIELVPNKKLVWEVTESNLSFLSKESEWTATRIGFDIENTNGETKVTFTHTGLTPQLECYNACSSAWTGYMERLQQLLN